MSIEQINLYESTLPAKLPSSFKNYLEELEQWVELLLAESKIYDITDLYSYKGRDPEIFPLYSTYLMNDAQKVELTNIYGLNPVFSPYQIEEINEPGLGKNLVPFADNGAGDYICISLNKDEYGSVVVWSHELFDPEKESSNLILVCDNFSEFKKGLLHK